MTLVIPALNEARSLPALLRDVATCGYEVIVVDGHSTDGTAEAARAALPGIRVVEQTRRGKGNALACGLAAATGDIVVMLDADGSHDPGEIPRFVAALRRGADFAAGSRFVPGGGSADLTRLRRWGNRALSAVTNALHATRATDSSYGFNAIWRRHVPVLDLEWDHRAAGPVQPMRWGDGFEIEALMAMRVARADLEVVEVPSFEHARTHGRSNLHAPIDGLRILRTIMRERLRRGRPRDEIVIDLTSQPAPSAPDEARSAPSVL